VTSGATRYRGKTPEEQARITATRKCRPGTTTTACHPQAAESLAEGPHLLDRKGVLACCRARKALDCLSLLAISVSSPVARHRILPRPRPRIRLADAALLPCRSVGCAFRSGSSGQKCGRDMEMGGFGYADDVAARASRRISIPMEPDIDRPCNVVISCGVLTFDVRIRQMSRQLWPCGVGRHSPLHEGCFLLPNRHPSCGCPDHRCRISSYGWGISGKSSVIDTEDGIGWIPVFRQHRYVLDQH
jgi:hypothetical protein